MGRGSRSPTPEEEENNVLQEDKYICTLSPKLQQIAKKELHEDANRREQALQEMRNWIKKTEYIKKCRLDANFLLRFLRHKKFHVPMAQEGLVRYITMRQQNPNWFQNASIKDPMVLDLIERGVAFPLPGRDKEGRRILMTVGGNIDPYKHTPEDVMKAILVVFESLLEDEENQVLGYSYLLDESGITTTHLTNLWNPTEIARIFAIGEKGLPIRHRAMQFMRLPPLLNAVLTFAKSFMSAKLKSRIVIYKTDEELKKNVDESLLPKEYGGKIGMKEMIEMFKDEVKSRQDRLLALDQMKVDVQLMSKMGTCGAALVGKEVMGGSGLPGSFRKLEID